MNLSSYLSGHHLTTKSSYRGSLLTRNARCECGEEFTWRNRDNEHTEHVIDEIARRARAEGYATAVRDLVDA